MSKVGLHDQENQVAFRDLPMLEGLLMFRRHSHRSYRWPRVIARIVSGQGARLRRCRLRRRFSMPTAARHSSFTGRTASCVRGTRTSGGVWQAETGFSNPARLRHMLQFGDVFWTSLRGTGCRSISVTGSGDEARRRSKCGSLTEERRGDVALGQDVPNHPGRPGSFLWKLVVTWAANGRRRGPTWDWRTFPIRSSTAIEPKDLP